MMGGMLDRGGERKRALRILDWRRGSGGHGCGGGLRGRLCRLLRDLRCGTWLRLEGSLALV